MSYSNDLSANGAECNSLAQRARNGKDKSFLERCRRGIIRWIRSELQIVEDRVLFRGFSAQIKSTPTLIPNVSLVIVNPITLQKLPVLLLKGHASMVLFLVTDVTL